MGNIDEIGKIRKKLMKHCLETKCLFCKRGSRHGKVRKQPAKAEDGEDPGSHEETM